MWTLNEITITKTFDQALIFPGTYAINKEWYNLLWFQLYGIFFCHKNMITFKKYGPKHNIFRFRIFSSSEAPLHNLHLSGIRFSADLVFSKVL